MRKELKMETKAALNVTWRRLVAYLNLHAIICSRAGAFMLLLPSQITGKT